MMHLPRPMKCLVLGGTRYFGKVLVTRLLAEGHKVTVLTRGQAGHVFGSDIEHIRCDRVIGDELRAALKGRFWDVVYDQICYAPDEASGLLAAIGERCGRLIVTSSQSVYDEGADLLEGAFNPLSEPLVGGNREAANYQLGKRRVEAVLAQQSIIPVTLVRFPIVLGPNDYTERLKWHVDRIDQNDGIFLPNPNARISFIHEQDAGEFLAWARLGKVTGPVNACSADPVQLSHLMELITQSRGLTFRNASAKTQQNSSHFGIEADWWMNAGKAIAAGFNFRPIKDWLPSLLQI